MVTPRLSKLDLKHAHYLQRGKQRWQMTELKAGHTRKGHSKMTKMTESTLDSSRISSRISTLDSGHCHFLGAKRKSSFYLTLFLNIEENLIPLHYKLIHIKTF